MPENGIVPPPVALALGICDLVYRDRGTGKRFIMGCFSVIHASDFPATHPGLGIYLDLTNGRGQVDIRVQIVDVNEERDPIWMGEQQVDFTDPRAVFESDLLISGITFPEPGEYRVQVFASNQFVIERRLIVNKVEQQ